MEVHLHPSLQVLACLHRWQAVGREKNAEMHEMKPVEGEVVEGVNDAEMRETKLVEVEVVEWVMNVKEHVGQETWKEP